MQRFLLVGSVLLASALFGACADDDLFTDCPLSNSIKAACAEETETTELTCVVERHPFCNEEICASWQGSDPFCSRACAADADCPAGSTCQEAVDVRFCVPDEELASN